jgi:vacuolar-type H+-ATPase subunit E/Vma4
MAGRDDLIHGFTRLVMQEADDKRKGILDEIEKTKNDLLKEKEHEFLEQAYVKVQDAVKETKRIRNEDYSKAMLESKKKLLMVRAKIMNDVFSNVLTRFSAFRQSDQYQLWIKGLISDGLKLIVSDHYLILCEARDQEIVEKAVKQLKIKADIQSDLEEGYGGIVLESKKDGLLLDLTIAEIIEQARENFLCYCGLCINRW